MEGGKWRFIRNDFHLPLCFDKGRLLEMDLPHPNLKRTCEEADMISFEYFSTYPESVFTVVISSPLADVFLLPLPAITSTLLA